MVHQSKDLCSIVLSQLTSASVILLATSLLAGDVLAQSARGKDEFPKLGGMQIGTSPYDGNLANADYRKEIARLDYAVISSPTTQLTNYAKDIKRHNPNIIIAKAIFNEINPSLSKLILTSSSS